MEVDGRSIGNGDGESISMEDRQLVKAEQMVVRFSGVVAKDLNVSVCPKKDSSIEGTCVCTSSTADNTNHSDIAFDSSGRSESRDMEMDTPDDANKNRTTSLGGVFQNAKNRSDVLNDVVDSNQCTSTDEDLSLIDAKTEKPEEPKFCVSDLVWSKVRSHPWYPGQIFDRSAATAKAKKYFKNRSFLIAYFGYKSFAWNEASSIKPFRLNFSHMENQNNMEEFHYAIDCALDEVSRRVVFGLACSCISEEAYAQVKTQIIVNAGIREESSIRDGFDRFSSAALFDPYELVQTMKALAQSPSYREVDRLQFTTSQAQLLAFHRWKGYSQLPEFQHLCGLLETDAEIPLSEEVKEFSELIQNDVHSVKVNKQVLSTKQKKTPKVPSKKEKSLSEVIAERRLSLKNGKKKLNKKAADKLISLYPAKKLKADDSVRIDSAVKQDKSNSSTGPVDKCRQSKQTSRVRARILKVASLLNSSTVSMPIFRYGDGTPSRSAVTNRSKGKPLSGKPPGKKAFQTDISSVNEIFSQLCLAATDPLKKCNFLASPVIFFTELRNSIAMDLNSSEMFEVISIKDSCCSDGIIQCLPEEQLAVDKHNRTMDMEVSPSTPSEKGFSMNESQSTIQPSPNMESEQKHTVTDENLGVEAENQIACSDENCMGDQSPTALILKFSDIDLVPSVEELNKIFSGYGPLVAPGAEVFKKSVGAKVVFKRRADAETAFSCPGKYSIFGHSLVSYRLKRLASTSTKASTNANKRSRINR